MPNTAIAIICKAPRPGSSKTRLIPALGAVRAAALSRAFLIDLSRTVADVAAEVGGKGYAVCSPASAAAELAAFLPGTFGYVIRIDPDLGRVLDGAVADLLDLGHDGVILVNGDSPTLPARLLEEAVAALRVPGARAVFGPALDGGYTSVGLKRREPGLFADIPWSTDAVLARSLEEAGRMALPVTLLEPWYDVDDAEGLAWLEGEFAGRMPPGLGARGAEATATRSVLRDGA